MPFDATVRLGKPARTEKGDWWTGLIWEGDWWTGWVRDDVYSPWHPVASGKTRARVWVHLVKQFAQVTCTPGDVKGLRPRLVLVAPDGLHPSDLSV
jgi:hypothetical protein